MSIVTVKTDQWHEKEYKKEQLNREIKGQETKDKYRN